MDQLNQILEDATAAITAPYFQLPIFGGPPVWRERVYCYELYHQMRIRWPEDSPLILTGEVDKRAHPIFRKLQARQAIPDLLVHSPGHMDQNFAIMEIKSQQAEPRGVQKDVETLREFRDIIGYQRALYLIFGQELPESLSEIPKDIEVWHHHEVGSPARIVNQA